ncbi:hypothetical protein [Desertibaculum subflavum]|uniref:hypothetical protein n=1 Tax=Desertibaculum subflavum TaxID=2268458 RepID=UPI000E662140
MELHGDYVFRFGGFDRQDRLARHLVGLGRITLGADGGLRGEHRATNSPMWGQAAPGLRLRHSIYSLSGRYEVIDRGPPLLVAAEIRFERQSRGPGGHEAAMQDTFLLQQSGPDRFWLISSNPRDETGEEVIDELVMGEAVKIDASCW